uniref:Uncharacterized protein n=1 Tax=Aegilops tauschii subsp. strangulata TaxID=200361 RepID=A0A453L3G6_AEGTS
SRETGVAGGVCCCLGTGFRCGGTWVMVAPLAAGRMESSGAAARNISIVRSGGAGTAVGIRPLLGTSQNLKNQGPPARPMSCSSWLQIHTACRWQSWAV